jgi:NH3-dependent NAD+ synthetase
VLTAERSALLNDQSLEAYVTALQQTVAPAATTTLSGRVDIARAVAVTQSAAAAAQVVLSGGVSGRGISAKSCAAALKVLEKELSVDAAATEFKVHTTYENSYNDIDSYTVIAGAADSLF